MRMVFYLKLKPKYGTLLGIHFLTIFTHIYVERSRSNNIQSTWHLNKDLLCLVSL